MKTHTLITQQELPISLELAWDFFSSPANLNKITPKDMSFEIKTKLDGEMYAGMLIDYTVKPLLNIPMAWTTEITHIKKGEYFIDEQRFGPYKLWHHEHHFEKTDKGVLMTDKLLYGLSFGVIGNALNSLFISKRIQEIFDFRYDKLNELFPK